MVDLFMFRTLMEQKKADDGDDDDEGAEADNFEDEAGPLIEKNKTAGENESDEDAAGSEEGGDEKEWAFTPK